MHFFMKFNILNVFWAKSEFTSIDYAKISICFTVSLSP